MWLLGSSKGSKKEKDSGAEPATGAEPTRASGALFVSQVTEDGSLKQDGVYTMCEAFVRCGVQRFESELVVVRSTNDPDAMNPSCTTPSTMIFPISPSARFENEDDQFGWSDASNKRFNFDVDEDPDALAGLRRDLANALFRSIYSAAPGPEDKDELATLLTPQPTVEDAPTSTEPSHDLPDTVDGALSDAVQDTDFLREDELIRVRGEFFVWDMESNQYRSRFPEVYFTISTAVFKEDNCRGHKMNVILPSAEAYILDTEISVNNNAQFFYRDFLVSWFVAPPNDEESDAAEPSNSQDIPCMEGVAVRIVDEKQFEEFRRRYQIVLYEIANNATVEELRMKADDIEYIANACHEFDAMDIDDPYETEEEEEADQQRRVTDADLHGKVASDDDGMENSQLAVAANHDSTFVVRGNRMGVFRTGERGAELRTQVNFKNPQDGTSFTPSKVLLHQMDESMLLLDPTDESRIMRMDLERGEVVDTWEGDLTANVPFKTVQHTTKYANRTAEQQFVGLNRNQLLRLDPRAREFIVQTKKYATGTRARMSCVATTGVGYLAVASENGDIRLFDQIGKNAKTHLPGLGDPIIGMDASEDGKFLLATTSKYLLLIDTRVKGQEKGGFQKSMGKNKPIPRKMTIRNEDIAKHRMGTINFTVAHFNTGSSLERSIVTSTGPFLVIWNFRQVKMGRSDTYVIKRYDDTVVADNFKYNDEDRIVVTLPNDVSVAKR